MIWRPSALPAVCTPSARANAAQAHALGQPAVSIQVRTAPTFGQAPAVAGALKINNYIGTIPAAAAAGLGATTSLSLTAGPDRKGQGDRVKGGDARGIPPRGTPV